MAGQDREVLNPEDCRRAKDPGWGNAVLPLRSEWYQRSGGAQERGAAFAGGRTSLSAQQAALGQADLSVPQFPLL